MLDNTLQFFLKSRRMKELKYDLYRNFLNIPVKQIIPWFLHILKKEEEEKKKPYANVQMTKFLLT